MSNLDQKLITPNVTIYTDGACSGNPGPGGWGAILIYKNQQKEIFGGEQESTNNRMELTAVISALNALKRKSKVDLYTDSRYVVNGITKWIHNWKTNSWLTSAKKRVENKDLWLLLDQVSDNHDIVWHWVKGHDGDNYNERADELARQAIPTQESTKKHSKRDIRTNNA